MIFKRNKSFAFFNAFIAVVNRKFIFNMIQCPRLRSVFICFCNIVVYKSLLYVSSEVSCNISNPTLRTGLDFKSAQFDPIART